MKKGILVLVAVILFVSIFAGCQKQDSGQNTVAGSTSATEQTVPEQNVQDQTQQQKEAVNITFLWENETDTIKDAWNKTVFEPFKKDFPYITVDFQPIPDQSDSVKVQLSAGAGPDMFMLDAFAVKEYAEAGLIEPLDAYVSKYGWDKIVYNWALNITKYAGKQYALPHSYESTFMFYNKDLLDANGWPVPTTRAEYEKVCSEAIKKGIIPIAFGASGNQLFYQWLIDHYLATYADNEAVKDLMTGKIKFDDPRIKGTFQVLEADWDKGWINERKSSGVSFDDARALWLNGKALFNTEGSWFTEEVVKGVNFNFGATKWPSMKDGVDPKVSVGIGSVIAINKSLKYKDECAELLNFMYTHDQNIAEGVALGLQPLARDLDTKLIPDTMDKGVRIVIDALIENTKQGQKVGYTPWTYFPNKTNIYLYEQLDKVFYNKMSIDEYLQGAQKLLDEEIKDGFVFAG